MDPTELLTAARLASALVPWRGDRAQTLRQRVTFAILLSAMAENVVVARRWVELYNERGDAAEFLALLDPEVELQTPGGPRVRGHDEVRDWFQKEAENVRSRIVPDRFVEEGDVVAALGRIELRWIESGEIAHEGESAAVFWFRDGRIVRWQPFETHDGALTAAGLAA